VYYDEAVRRGQMNNRIFLIVTSAVAALGAAAILSTVALASSSADPFPSQGSGQDLPSRVLAAPSDPNPTEDALHVFDASSGAAAQARVPLSLADVTIEAGIRSDGSICFDATFPLRPQAGLCEAALGANGLSGVLDREVDQPQLFFGLVGDAVTDVSVTTDMRSYDATVSNGAFYVSFPADARPSSWVASLADGSTTSGDLSFDNDNPLLNQ
jgi:hypothetical protein